MNPTYCLPAEITPEIFVRDYWQKKPLLIRNGLPQIVGLLEPQDIIELSQGEEVTARLIKQFSDDNWELHPLMKNTSKSSLKNGRCWCKTWSNGR